MPRLRTPRRFQNGKHMSRVKNDNLMKMYSSKERRGFWAALGRLWAGFGGSLAVMCLLGLLRHGPQEPLRAPHRQSEIRDSGSCL